VCHIDSMGERLLERAADLHALERTLDEASEGGSSLVLISGEAGTGKSSLVAAFRSRAAQRARFLTGACDDLLTPRTFGPLRDAVEDHPGPLATALHADPDRESVYRALRAELRGSRPSVLVIEDLHWADDATIDALRYLIRRVDTVNAVVVLTCRTDDVDDAPGLPRLMGALATHRVLRLRLGPLSRPAILELAGDADAVVDVDHLLEVTGGNPFFVSEVLACEGNGVPATVVDAVMARVGNLSPATRAAVEQLAVVPARVDLPLLNALLPNVEILAEAERRRLLEVRVDGVAFRHEIARRAIVGSVPGTLRATLHRPVLRHLLAEARPDLSRVMHHAVSARAVSVILSHGPEAARQASLAGSHRQALAHYEQVAPHLQHLDPRDRARLLVDHAWELYAAQRWLDAVATARRGLDLWAEIDDQVAIGRARVVISRASFMAGRPADAIAQAEQAVAVLEPTGDIEALAHAESYLGAVQALTDRQEEALPRLLNAQALAQRADRLDLVALCNNYIGCVRVDLGDVSTGLGDLRRSLHQALSLPHHEYAARAYTNLAETTYLLRRFDELRLWIDAGARFATDHDLPGHLRNLEAHRALMLMGNGGWEDAQSRLECLVNDVAEPDQLTRLTLPPLGRLLARRGDGRADAVLQRAWDQAVANGSLAALAPAGLAVIEAAWLAGDVSVASAQIAVLMHRTEGRAGARVRGELLAYLARAGWTVEPFEGCPDHWALAVAGAHAEAAELWRQIGDPYERALELAATRSVPHCLEALSLLDELGAAAAVRQTRMLLRQIGASHIPRGRRGATRLNPAGLTSRQVDVLKLVATGLTNAQIAARLVVSTRTVDHHVSAILTCLHVNSRREAAGQALALGLVAGDGAISV
jgi:ATP/maltotriose-dependent transcriptional regulator MalT